VTSPADRSLAPLDVREHGGWLKLIHNVFQQKNVDTVAEARGVAPSSLSKGHVEFDQRGDSQNTIGVTRRGEMAPVPTPQSLIRQVTGIGDPINGR